MKIRRTIFLTILLPALVLTTSATFAQGIKFEQGMTWEQIQDKARTEHKYIFVDCYATWCGPCKAMDEHVYPAKEVGHIFNKQFIAVKVQMDRTANDDANSKAWYKTADMLAQTYAVDAYPCFLFFDPDGNIVHKAMGYRDANAFIQLAADAQNPDKQYYHILKDYQPGKFVQDMTWQQIQDKAKMEHKYVFVDCYATWCGPCKAMDQEVYPSKEVGDILKKQFIAVKVQMDRTANDDAHVKSWYQTAAMLDRNYTINAYPCFLFFGPDGNIVHKAMGYRSAKDFVQLAADAQNPDKQYYSILKNYQPGKLDTAELKGLARAFRNQDKTLAGKMAADYLARIPIAQLAQKDNGMLMVQFQYDPGVLNCAFEYIKGLDKVQISDPKNVNFIRAFTEKQAEIRGFIISYLTGLNLSELSNKGNQGLLEAVGSSPQAKVMAKNFINSVPEDQFYTKDMVDFLECFTNDIADRGFQVVLKNPTKIDAIMGSPDFAENFVLRIIGSVEFVPLLEKAKNTGVAPDWTSLYTNISDNFGIDYGQKETLLSKLEWFDYLINTKKEQNYWPELIAANISLAEYCHWDTSKIHNNDINELGYHTFLYSNDKAQLKTVTRLMKTVVERGPNNLSEAKYTDDVAFADTYACLLYKNGQRQDAVHLEQQIFDLYAKKNRTGQALYTKELIEKMERGEDIWLDKEVQNN